MAALGSVGKTVYSQGVEQSPCGMQLSSDEVPGLGTVISEQRSEAVSIPATLTDY
jgi:hypothetical protein